MASHAKGLMRFWRVRRPQLALSVIAITLASTLGRIIILRAQDIPSSIPTQQEESATLNVARSVQEVDAPTASAPTSVIPEATTYATAAGAGLVINPTFDAGLDAATRNVINNAINFYQSTFTNNITVNIY